MHCNMYIHSSEHVDVSFFCILLLYFRFLNAMGAKALRHEEPKIPNKRPIKADRLTFGLALSRVKELPVNYRVNPIHRSAKSQESLNRSISLQRTCRIFSKFPPRERFLHLISSFKTHFLITLCRF